MNTTDSTLKQAAENVCRQCMNIQPNEKILIITDTIKKDKVGLLFYQAAQKVSENTEFIIIKPTGQHGAEPPANVADQMKQVDVILMPTHYSLSHTKARKQACQSGARVASMPGITKDIIKRTLTADYSETAKLTKKITGLLTQAETAYLTSPAGTKLTIPLQNRQAIADTGLLHSQGDFGNLPAGEAFIAPLENKTTGILCFEQCYGERILTEPVKFKINKGYVSQPVSANKQTRQIIKELNQTGRQAKNIGELGIGTNKKATFEGGLLELEKIHGTCHLALGNNAHFGGKVNVPYHIDGLILQPTLKLDNKMIIKNGKFVI
jgi:leucyl aminopeptidase (aminopeptidase T)